MIPNWEMSGLLPPIRPGLPGHDPDRSPYVVHLQQVIERFATSPERVEILRGLLAYRHELHQLGINTGFQWVDGSFTEQIEVLESRAPRDVDVVSFLELPSGTNQQTMFANHPELFTPQQVKARFKVDAYCFFLGQTIESYHVKQISYWYSMWSHRRGSGMWKGFVQVNLSSDEDHIAQEILNHVAQEGEQV